MVRRFVCAVAGAMLASVLLLAESDLNVRKAELSTMFGSAAG